MAISYAFLGMLCMLDCLLFGNYSIVSALRLLSNAEAEADARDRGEQDSSTDYENRGDPEEHRRHHDGEDDSYNHLSFWENLRGTQRLYTAIFLGFVTREACSTRSFPKWRVVWGGVLSTAILLILSTVVLSNEAVLNLVLADPLGDSSLNFCVTEDFDDKIAALQLEINETTHIEVARKQYEHTVGFHHALVNDTTLYGTENYECPDILDSDGTVSLSGNKDDWLDHSVPPAAVNGNFFPGYCGAALQAAIASAKAAECVQEVCDCPWIPRPFLEPIKSCLGGIARVCVSVPVACPMHTADEEQELQDYRQVQLETAEQQRELEFDDSFPVDLPEDVLQAGETVAQKILFQVDVASSLYVAFSILSLVFPAPLVLFRPPFVDSVRIYLFGAHKITFILFVVSAWWGVEYFRTVFMSPEIRLYLRNLRDPCFLDGDYVFTRQKIINDVCKDLVPMEGIWRRSIVTIQHVLVEASYFISTCSCSFPIQDLGNFRTPEHITVAEADAIGFGNRIDGLPYILTPKDTQEFVGDTTICTDSELARSIVMEAASNTESSFWGLWIATGLLARVLIKVAVCNFGIALYRVADPLSICAGRFEWPSTRFKLTDSTSKTLEQVKLEKETIYRWVALKSTVLWGILTHVCLINLMLTAWNSGASTELQSDEKLGIAAFAIGLFSLPVGWFVTTRIALRRMEVEKRSRSKDSKIHDGSDATSQEEIPITIEDPENDDEFEMHTYH